MLFGEYGILAGSDALTVPAKDYYGEWTFADRPTKSNSLLEKFHSYLQKEGYNRVLILPEFQSEIEKGLVFTGNIPEGYGMGSSGALTAAVLKKYSIQSAKYRSLQELKNILAGMESFFHGTSSGIDPLSCYAGKPVFFRLNDIDILNPIKSEYTFFLLDSGIPRNTSKGVKFFMNQLSDSNFKSWFTQQYIPLNNRCIEDFISASSGLFDNFDRLSRMQLELFPQQLPETIQAIWKDVLRTELTRLKLCGAGGGGFFIGITKKDMTPVEEMRIIPFIAE